MGEILILSLAPTGFHNGAAVTGLHPTELLALHCRGREHRSMEITSSKFRLYEHLNLAEKGTHCHNGHFPGYHFKILQKYVTTLSFNKSKMCNYCLFQPQHH